ncbi:MAG: hypothetical protein PHT33_09555 [bacterium]|nr:hypothetical protein [bacterium]
MVLNIEIFIRCKCGHTITAKEFLQIRVYLKPGEPTFVNAQFQCKNCRQIGEHHLVAEEILQQASQLENGYLPSIFQEDNDEDLVVDMPLRQTENNLPKPTEAISCDEIIDFHFQLEKLQTTLPDI